MPATRYHIRCRKLRLISLPLLPATGIVCIHWKKPFSLTCFFSAAGDGMVVRWNLQAPDQGELIANIPASVYALHCIPTANQLWIGQNFEGVHVIDLHTKKEIRSVKVTAAAIF